VIGETRQCGDEGQPAGVAHRQSARATRTLLLAPPLPLLASHNCRRSPLCCAYALRAHIKRGMRTLGASLARCCNAAPAAAA